MFRGSTEHKAVVRWWFCTKNSQVLLSATVWHLLQLSQTRKIINPYCETVPLLHISHPKVQTTSLHSATQTRGVSCASCWVKASVVSHPKDFISSLQFTASAPDAESTYSTRTHQPVGVLGGVRWVGFQRSHGQHLKSMQPTQQIEHTFQAAC